MIPLGIPPFVSADELIVDLPIGEPGQLPQVTIPRLRDAKPALRRTVTVSGGYTAFARCERMMR